MLRVVLAGLISLVLMSGKASGQIRPQAEQGGSVSPQISQLVSSSPFINLPAALAATQRAQRNVDRQNQIVSDTNKLVALVSNLKQQAEKTDSAAVPAADLIKKAEEIEKLARSVKEHMKG
jgi:hypothetical protein